MTGDMETLKALALLVAKSNLATNDLNEVLRAEFIAAASPSAILDLIDENERLRKYAERYRWLQQATPYAREKIQELSVIHDADGVQFHWDRYDALVDIARLKEGGS